ncbi:hypothetical protein [Marinoscillum sp.]|uniref:hypothetical protein n=1 Tax=Marinoscillum sp. TaxID=2024838 RepID=UPI003BA8DE6B
MAKIQIEPVTIYQRFELEPGKTEYKFTFGEDSSNSEENEILFSFGELDIVRKLLTNSTLCYQFFRSVGIEYPNCWIGIEIKTKDLIPEWPHSKPGDLDIIAGNFLKGDGAIDTNSAIGFQVKIRKIESINTLKAFSTGFGRKQTSKTVEMGFTRTYLTHAIIRKPRAVEPGQSISWGAPHNADFNDAIVRSLGSIYDDIENAPFGYNVLGWGQPKGMDWRTGGAFSSSVLKEAPKILDNSLNPFQKTLFNSLKTIFSGQREVNKPLIIDGSSF